jgi:hypothetical protein
MRLSQSLLEKLLAARAEGATLRQAADAAGVHVATVCRWQNHAPDFHHKMQEAHQEARRREHLINSGPLPHVPWRRDCPLCKARVVVRTASRGAHFWRCGRWLWCSWASWRPRAPRNCGKCGGPCYWSHSRKSISCVACGVRILAHLLRCITTPKS